MAGHGDIAALVEKMKKNIAEIDQKLMSSTGSTGSSHSNSHDSSSHGSTNNRSAEIEAEMRRNFPWFGGRKAKNKSMFVKETFTTTFVCLSSHEDGETFTPTRGELAALTEAGLGRKKIKFEDKRGTHEVFEDELYRNYPKLRQGHGFLLYKPESGGAGRRLLTFIPPGKNGYSIPYVRSKFDYTTIYIKPLQQSLSLNTEAINIGDMETSSPSQVCIECGDSILVQDFPSHRESCSKIPPLSSCAKKTKRTAGSAAEDSPPRISLTASIAASSRKRPKAKSDVTSRLQLLAGSVVTSPSLVTSHGEPFLIRRLDTVINVPTWGDDVTVWLEKDMVKDPIAGGMREASFWKCINGGGILKEGTLYVLKRHKQTVIDDWKSYYTDDTDKHLCQREVQTQQAAKVLVDEFNQARHAENDKLSVIECYLCHTTDCKYFTLEENLPGEYKKYNTNMGQIDSRHDIMEALSHFSLDYSEKKLVVLDLQGVGYKLTDVQVISHQEETDTSLQFSIGNAGQTAIEQFMSTHLCNKYCRELLLEELKKGIEVDSEDVVEVHGNTSAEITGDVVEVQENASAEISQNISEVIASKSEVTSDNLHAVLFPKAPCEGHLPLPGKSCGICLTNCVQTSMVPCGHVCCCYHCALQIIINDDNCPLCRGKVTTFTVLYT